jgi:hypothetical protein
MGITLLTVLALLVGLVTYMLLKRLVTQVRVIVACIGSGDEPVPKTELAVNSAELKRSESIAHKEPVRRAQLVTHYETFKRAELVRSRP